jgi:tetratricopeptide (TPR) repeat protein
MKFFFQGFVCIAFLSGTVIANGQKMTWTTNSDQARTLAMEGAHHLMNVEYQEAYDDFGQALKLDPDFTVALALMSNLNRGTTSEEFAKKAVESSKDKTEGEKLFVSLLDTSLTQDQRSETWSKLHDMFPDGKFVSYLFVVTRKTPDEQFNAALDYSKKFPDEPAIYNYLAYQCLQVKKDTAKAKEYFEKYLAMYPDGYNPYDSMGEFYLDTGDTADAKKYYEMSLEKYPFNVSSIEALEKINNTSGK